MNLVKSSFVERIDADNSVDSTDTSGLTRKERKDRKKTRLDKIHKIKEGALNKSLEVFTQFIQSISVLGNMQ
jgi:hypothetical protein